MALLSEATVWLTKIPTPVVIPPPPPIAGTPVVIVIDPGHGGIVKVDGSSPNNATSPSGELEKNWTLDIAKRTKAAALAKAVTLGKNIDVVLTRETDSNKGLTARANIAKNKGAKLFLSIHFNGFDKNVRGVETLIHPINVNKEQDRVFAQLIQDQVLAALHEIDPSTRSLPKYDRKVKEQTLGVLNDVALGNTVASHPCSACLVEIEFMDVPAVEQLFRLMTPQVQPSEEGVKNRQKIADALSNALLAQVDAFALLV
jgi:N-acetylmuramoyl-L-alanine amidase